MLGFCCLFFVELCPYSISVLFLRKPLLLLLLRYYLQQKNKRWQNQTNFAIFFYHKITFFCMLKTNKSLLPPFITTCIFTRKYILHFSYNFGDISNLLQVLQCMSDQVQQIWYRTISNKLKAPEFSRLKVYFGFGGEGAFNRMVCQFEIKALQNSQFPQNHDVALLFRWHHMLCYDKYH